MLLALFVIELAAGLYLFLPLVGRRDAGVKFYRLILIISGSLAVIAVAAHLNARAPRLAEFDAIVVVFTALVWFVLRYPKRLIFRAAALLLAVAFVVACVASFHAAVRPSNFL